MKKCPQRYVILIMGTLGSFCSFTTRIAINMAITQMVTPKNISESETDYEGCMSEPDADKETVKISGDLYDWTEWQQGLILGAFFVGCIMSQIPAGICCDKFGARHVMGGGLLLSTVDTLLTPVIVLGTNGNWIALASLRVVQGLGQGVLFPSMSSLTAKWCPKKTVSLFGTTLLSGILLGAIIGNFVNGSIMAFSGSWASIFYFWGGLALLWNILWYIFCFSTPQSCRYISKDELEFLERELGVSKQKLKVPWKHIMSSVPVWCFIVSQVGADWGFHTLNLTLPKYLQAVLKFKIQENGLWNCIPYMFMFVSTILSGILCNFLIRRRFLTTTMARKIFSVVACVGPAIFTIGASYAECNTTLAVWMFVVAFSTMGTIFCGMKINGVDLSPTYAGTLMALNNTGSAVVGLVAPAVAGALTTNVSCVIPQRYLMAFMGMQSGFHAYTTRIALNMAITQMVELEESTNTTVGCPAEEDFYESSAKIEGQIYDWSEWKQGIILGAFFWGYVITHIPAGIISDKYGVRHVLGLGILSSVILTLLTPIIITETNGNWIVLSCLRIFQGLGQGVLFPCSSTLIAKWTPPKELSFIGTFVFSGIMMGTVIGSLVNGHLMSYTKTWSSIFYLWGGIGLIWTACWYLLCYSTPHDSPFISEKELIYLQEQLGTPTQEKFKVPWKQFFKSPPVYAYVLTQVGCDYGFYTLVTDLPKYLNDVLKFNLKNNGLWNSIPFMFMTIISLVSGVISDQLIRHNKITVTFARKFFTVIGCLIPAMLLMVASYSGCDRVLAAWMFVLATGFLGCTFCAIKVNAADLSPKFSGTLMALNNGVAAFTGIGAPFVAGALTTNHTMQEWQIVFWINFSILITSALIFGIWSSGKQQWWNDSPVKPTEGPATST